MTLAALAALAMPAAMPLAAHAATPAAAPAHDPAKVAVAKQILANFGIVDSLTLGGKSGLGQDDTIKALPKPDQDMVMSLFSDEMMKRKATIIDAVAPDNVDRFTLDQLNAILNLSKIKYVHDLVLSGADPSLPEPDPTTMTQAEAATFKAADSQPFVSDFMRNMDVNASVPFVHDAAENAMKRFKAAKTPAQ